MKYITINKEAIKQDLVFWLGRIKTRAVYYGKQLLPLTYRSHYAVGEKKMFSVFKMWFGRTYKVENFVVAEYGTENEWREQEPKEVLADINRAAEAMYGKELQPKRTKRNKKAK